MLDNNGWRRQCVLLSSITMWCRFADYSARVFEMHLHSVWLWLVRPFYQNIQKNIQINICYWFCCEFATNEKFSCQSRFRSAPWSCMQFKWDRWRCECVQKQCGIWNHTERIHRRHHRSTTAAIQKLTLWKYTRVPLLIFDREKNGKKNWIEILCLIFIRMR